MLKGVYMSFVEYAFVFALVLTVLPFAMVQMEVSLNQDEDVEAFCLWVCLAGLMAGLPFMVTTMEQVV
jgi:hypothetical protein